MQNALLIVDSHPKLRKIMLSILSKLTIVNNEDFSVNCFNTLIDLMQASKDLEIAVMETLEKEVISKFNTLSADQIPISLLKGLNELVKKSKSASMLRPLFDQFFTKFLDEIKRKSLETVQSSK